MALFKKFKDDIGLDEEENEENEEEEETEEKAKSKHSAKKEEKRRHDDDNDKKSGDWLESKGQLAADVYETENDFCIQAPVAGVNQDEIEIFVENNMLVIRGERTEPDTSSANRKYYYKECYWGPFSRQTMLPEDANTQRISASFRKGVLTIKIPKKKVEKRKITIDMD